MAVVGLDHVNIRTADPISTLGFFRDVLGMRVGLPPGATNNDFGGWIYDTEDRPVVHVGGLNAPYPSDTGAPVEALRGGGAVHHVALSCSGFEATQARLKDLDVEFRANEFPQFNLRQIFVTEPNGVLLELNFRPDQ
jgi:catechol 2,3-dioxygenase-like lactoylglutathione lyase family enzyme